MPKSSQYVFIRSHEPQHYELQTQRQVVQRFHQNDAPALARWLEEHTSFAFVGQTGTRLSLLKEARPRGGSYWYAYHKQGQHNRKRYLGSTDQVTFARLEQEAKILTSEPAPAASVPLSSVPGADAKRELPSEMRGLMLAGKLSAPRLPGFLVERSRLQASLDAIGSYPLTLVSATAGSGKTTLLSAWAASQKVQEGGKRQQTRQAEALVAWLSLEELDDDPVRFWELIIAALRRCRPMSGEMALALLHSPESLPLSVILTALLQEFEQSTQEIILILDDYHVISDQAIADSMLFLIDHLPACLHLVLMSRTDPDLPLSRFRVRGQLIEIRDRDLRFSQQEASRFLCDAMGLPLSEEEVTVLSQRTEGWIAGLRLAALSLRQQPDHLTFVKDFAGTHRYLLDYIQQDILASLPMVLRDFLLQTSILSRMNAALCQTVASVADETESQRMLEELERANLFVVPLDDERRWYRYHDLFREALRARLQMTNPEWVPQLHLRAARYYEMQGEWREAITHAFAASHPEYAAALIEQAAGSYWFRGEARIIHSWVFSLSDAILRGHLRLALDAALRFIDSVNLGNKPRHTSTAAQVETTFTRIEALIHPPDARLLREKQLWSFSEHEVVWIEQRLIRLRALIELRTVLRQNNALRLQELILELEALPEDKDASWNIIQLYLTFWLTTVYQEYGVPLIQRLRAAKQQLLEAKDYLMATRVMSWLAFVSSTYAGHLKEGQQECLEALALAERLGTHTPWEGYLYYCLFVISYSWNRLEEAPDWLERLRRQAQNWQQMQLLATTEIFSAQLGLAKGDLAAAQEALHQLEILLGQGALAYHAPWITVLRVQLWLAQGDLATATEWAAQSTVAEQSWSPLRRWELLMLVRVLLADSQYERAFEILERFRQHLDREGVIDTVLEFRALSFVALHHMGKREQAQQVAGRLFAMTEPEGHLRVYLDEGLQMRQALCALIAQSGDTASDAEEAGITRSYVRRLLAAFEEEEQQKQAKEEMPQSLLSSPGNGQGIAPTKPGTGKRSNTTAFIEPLTRREQEVLHLLAEGASNQQIAETLVIQLSTVKKHVSSLLLKLGAESRTQAIAQARTFSLL
ncbi:MAG TPA: LuxR C-terminal-related transcriptional regulator [Ktedonosporobacter sp.]|nr:LuxR C-terminal-related transcriptional regulator [Ktedonosporobacter sp.]